MTVGTIANGVALAVYPAWNPSTINFTRAAKRMSYRSKICMTLSSARSFVLVPHVTPLITRVAGHGIKSATNISEIQVSIKISSILALILFSAAACAPTEFQQFEAISELEQHCELPDNILAETYMRAQRGSANRAVGRADFSQKNYLLYLGNDVSDQRILNESDCIKSFISKDGFRFNFHAISPTEI